MKLSPFLFSLIGGVLVTTAEAQLQGRGPASTPQKAQAGVKGQPVKPTKAQLQQMQQQQGIQFAPQGGAALLVGGGDDCATPDIISGVGTFSVDTTVATTSGVPITCGAGAANNDVWFHWTAPGSGTTIVDLCGTTGSDTIVAVWGPMGASCPGGTPLACIDDACGLQTSLSFNATAGSGYMIQVGGYSSGVFYTAAMTITQPPPITNDDCFTATPISGLGTFALDTTGATGTIPNFVCAQPNNDVWFAWTATATGPVQVNTCGTVTQDSVLAVWDSSACPPTTLVDCNDDFCGLQTQSTFLATSGTTYFLQWGAFGGATTYTGAFNILNAPPPPADDDCTTPSSITPGAGPYPFDNTAATTGAQGQAEGLCLFFGSTTIDNDIWVTWGPAPASSPFRVSTCGTTGVDTKIAIYDGAGCPAASAIACNDDDCGFQTGVVFNAVAGQSYTLQIGTFPNAFGGTGTFDVTPFVPPPGDDCGTPVAIAGPGPHPFDNTAATTGAQGQSEAICFFFGSTVIDRDVWYCWTAPTTEVYEFLTVGQTGVDTKVAVYDGCGCPAGAALSCNDDACGTLQTGLSFSAVAGQTYTIQLGTFPGASGGTGSFTIAPAPPGPTGCVHDDGTTENAIGIGGGGNILWMNRAGEVGVTTTLSDVSTAYGSLMWPGSVPNGSPSDILVWDDTDDDGDPRTGLVLVSQIASTVQNADTDMFNSTPIAPPLSLNGIFFIGAAVPHSGGTFPAPLDQSGGGCSTVEISWVAGSTTAFLDYNNLNGAPLPLSSIGSQGFPGIWLTRGSCSTEPGTEFCPGDGTLVTPCPCGNSGATGNGCASSFNPSGAHLSAIGATNPDTVVLQGAGMNATGNCIFLKGDLSNPNGLVFGDGLRCADGTLIRMRTKALTGGTANFPEPGDPSVSVRGATPPGSGLNGYYHVYYRNAAAAFCPPETFNSSNGYHIVW